ncbi:MAG: adenylosuccinate lyase [Bacteroidales bacterium]|nr:adenylosuccinate lyase [Bacteroidales bacterium]MDY3977248.1 adenylosuccinate lyase [Candidatus Onthomorpha sp.]MCI5716520.1 adenylosuccinate lyase [Bacteroidales bacterium]MCI6644658.1 adenylosuccinate lyase [Bacteroidales bacterium]MCI6900453.1 adenylosuccinate lyase [Bacteroidales bacterium]
MESLNAITPIDGRYRRQVEELSSYFSEAALIRYRVKVEVEYFIALCQLPLPQLKDTDPDSFEAMRNIYRNFSTEDAKEVKEIEKTTNHDVKAVEYFLKRHFEALGLDKHKEFIHFGLTSQDINNTSVPLSLKDCHTNSLLPKLQEVLAIIDDKAEQWKKIPMLAHTHGQPASPTLLGKEMKVFAYRLQEQLKYFENIPFAAKFGGATGNFNAHNIAFPQYNWVEFANKFCSSLGLKRSLFTTQIENYDNLAAYFDNLRRLNIILIDFCRDMWQYISMEYFKQKIKEGEVGSSAMPHKVNPIDFENAEGNLGMANAVLTHLSMKMPISRLQRDLTDSTVSRNIGVPIAHTLIALNSIIKGMNKIILNNAALEQDLENNWAVVAEALQTILRSLDYPNPYETLKALTRTNSKITKETISQFIDTLNVDEKTKQRMKAITPSNYVGVYADLL